MVDDTDDNPAQAGSAPGEGFWLPFWGSAACCVLGLVATVLVWALGLEAGWSSAGTLSVFFLGGLLAWWLVACIKSGQRSAWSRLSGQVTGVLLVLVLLIMLIANLLSDMRIGGF